MQLIDVREAQATLPQLLDATSQGEEFVITRAEQPVAKLVQIIEADDDLRYGSAKGLVFIGPEFDLPLEEFSDYQ